MKKTPLIIPGKDIELNMSLIALQRSADFILTHNMQPGDDFTIEGTDGKNLTIHIK